MSGVQSFGFKACQAPLLIEWDDKPSISVPCGKCDWCMMNRRNDLAGRALVEALKAPYCCMVTLTYRNNADGSLSDGAHDFISDHLSRFVRSERKRGKLRAAGLRYLATGERGPNGSKRCHYHVFMWFKDGRPGHWPSVQSSRDRIHLASWPHGHVTISESMNRGHMAHYVAYYAYKSGPDAMEQTPDGPRKLFAGPFFSRNPVLGHDFAVQFARDHVERGIIPWDASYTLKAASSAGKDKRYFMKGTMRAVMMESFVEGWRAKFKSDPPITEFLMEKYFDPIARREMARDDAFGVGAEILARPRPSGASIQFDLDEQDASAAMPDVADLAVTVCRVEGGNAVLTAKADKTATLHAADPERPVLITCDPAVSARVQLLRAGVSPADARALGRWLNRHWWQVEREADLAERREAAARASRRRSRRAEMPIQPMAKKIEGGSSLWA